MDDDPTTDSTPAWFTPPEPGRSASPGRPAAQTPPSPTSIDLEHTFAVTGPGETFAVTGPGETFAEAPREAGAWPAAPPARPAMTALAPPTPLVRPIITKTRASEEIRAGEPPATEPRGSNGDGGPGWRVRAGHEAPPDDEPARPLASLLEPPHAEDELPAFVVPLMPWEKKRRQRPLRRYTLLGVGLFALCGIAALAVTNVGPFAHGIQQPQAIGSLGVIDSPQVNATLETLDHYERSLGASSVATGAYGSSGQTQLVLVVVQTAAAANGGAPIDLQKFVHGLTTGLGSVGLVLDPSKSTTSTADGTTFACDTGPASSNGGTALSMCAWSDARAAGAAVDVTGLSSADVLNEAVQARAAAEH